MTQGRRWLRAQAEQDFVCAMSLATRLRRFHVGLRELPRSLLRAMTEVDHDDQPRIVADARYGLRFGLEACSS